MITLQLAGIGITQQELEHGDGSYRNRGGSLLRAGQNETLRPASRAMAIVRGRFINLASSTGRRRRLEQHLHDLGISKRYSWFPAISGDATAAAALGLGAGEWGLWQSWLQLLQEELNSPEASFDWLHIVEDDAELSRPFRVFCQQLKPGLPAFELLFTDMYVNPSIYRSFAPQHQALHTRGEVQFKTDLYTGCTASVLIHRDHISKVLHHLKTSVDTKGALLPLDNQLRRLIHQRQLRFARTAPFLSGVQNASIAESTIQNRVQENRSVVLTQQICTNLRRQLSLLDCSNANHAMIQLMLQLAGDHSQPNPTQLNQSITLRLIQLAEDHNLLSYRPHPRLRDEPDNPVKYDRS